MSSLIPPAPAPGRSRTPGDAADAVAATASRGSVDPVPFFRAHWDGRHTSVRGDAAVYRSAIPDGIPNHGDPFASWTWDGQTLTIRTDPTGFYPLFYHLRGAEIAISTSLVRLLDEGASRELDDMALAVLLRFTGGMVGEDTPFRDIRLVPPDACLTWSRGQLGGQGRYARAPVTSLSRDQAIDAYIDLVHTAIRRRPPVGGTVVPLSGGRDSRHLFLALCHVGYRPDACVTMRYFPTIRTDDVEVAGNLAAALGVPHFVSSQPRNQLRQERRKDLETHFCAIEHAWIPAMADFIRGRWDTVYEGVAGDTLSTGIFATPERQRLFDAGRFEELADKFLWPEGYLPTMLSPERYRRSSRAAASERVARELARHSDEPNPIGSFCFWNRTRRVTSLAPFAILNAGTRVYTPYLDTDVFTFLASLPAHMLQNEREYHRFHSDTISRAYPEFAHMPYAAKYPIVGRSVGTGHAWQTSAALLWQLARGSGAGLLRRGLVSARLAYCMGNPLYTTRVAELAPSLSYLIHLADIAASRRDPGWLDSTSGRQAVDGWQPPEEL